jgi:hypothetical protein
VRTNETPVNPNDGAFDDMIRWERNSVFTRFPCVLCDGGTQKQNPLAVAYAAGHVPLTADPTGEEVGMVCHQCVEAGPEAVAGRLEAEAERLEDMATERRRAAQFHWSFARDEERQRLRAEVDAESAAFEAAGAAPKTRVIQHVRHAPRWHDDGRRATLDRR